MRLTSRRKQALRAVVRGDVAGYGYTVYQLWASGMAERDNARSPWRLSPVGRVALLSTISVAERQALRYLAGEQLHDFGPPLDLLRDLHALGLIAPGPLSAWHLTAAGTFALNSPPGG